ncbi:MAG: PLP-dependent aminotransferase family protein [Hyphomicrobiales bacterium]
MTIWMPVLDRSKPLYVAIADAIARDVEAGTLPVGVRLPPQRELAWKIGVTLGTVTRAYKEAEDRGLLSGEVGRGSYVRKPQHLAPLPAPSPDVEAVLDLSNAIPPPVVSAAEFDAALAAVMRDPRRLDLLDYAPVEGFPQHKAMAAEWLKRSGLAVPQSNIVITPGAHLGFITVLEALRDESRLVLTEEVNYAALRHSFRMAQVEPVPLPMDADGLLPDALEQAAIKTGARLIYLVPSLQNPTTNTMSRRRRDAIVSVARRHGLTIIEDDIFRLLDPRTQPPPFYGLAPERTYHVTGLSKTLAPGLRIGMVALPQGQERLVKNHLRYSAPRNAGLTGEVARHWIETGLANDILTRTINELAARREVFLQVFKACDFRCDPGAPFAWLKLPEPWNAAAFAGAAAARNVKITAGSAFALGPDRQASRVRICFGGPGNGPATRRGLEIIRELMNERPEEDFTPVA